MTVALNHLTLKNLNKPGRYTDAIFSGLHFWVKTSKHKYWVYRFTINNKQKDLSLGSYPLIALKEAREKAEEARELIKQGKNPIDERKRRDITLAEESIKHLVFRDFALAYIEKKSSEWRNKKHAAQWLYTLEEFAFPKIGHKGLNDIKTEDILSILTPIWNTRTNTASRLRGRLELVLASACAQGLRDGMNPALWKGHLQAVLPAPNKVSKVRHHKALPYKDVPKFMIELMKHSTMASLALEFTILNASRTGEVINAKRSEIVEDVWTIPASRMKAYKEHQVPLCSRSLEIIRLAELLDPNSDYLFSRNKKPLSNMAMAQVLKRLNSPVTVHGFRSTFRDWVSEETLHSGEVAEMALAHTIGNKVESAYRRGNLREKRRSLLLDWQNYCLSLEAI